MKNTITEMKNALDEIYSRLDKAEHHISNVEDKVVVSSKLEQQKEK